MEIHGRWPLVGAVAVAPVTALAVKRSELRPLAALLWHQTEEWVWPGGFLPWINREVIGSEQDEFPLGRRLGFAINVLFGWGFSVAATRGASAACAERAALREPPRQHVAPRLVGGPEPPLRPRQRHGRRDADAGRDRRAARAREGPRRVSPRDRRGHRRRCGDLGRSAAANAAASPAPAGPLTGSFDRGSVVA